MHFPVRSQNRSFVFSACIHTYGRQYGHWWVLKLDVFWECVSQSHVTHTHSCYTELFFPSGLISPSKWLTTLSKSLSKQVYSHPSRPLQSIGLALLLNPLRMCFGQLWNLCLLHICRQLQSTLNPNSPKHPRLSYKQFQRPLKDWIQVPVENMFLTMFSDTLDLSVCSPTPVLKGQARIQNISSECHM